MSRGGDGEEECQLDAKIEVGSICEWLKGGTCKEPEDFAEIAED